MKIAFYFDYDKYGYDQAPAILQFVEYLRKKFKVDFFTNEKELLRDVKKYDVLGISVFSSHELFNAILSSIKAKIKNENVVTIVGGQGIYGFEDKLIKVPSIDIVVKGEAELSLPVILNNLKPTNGRKIFREIEIKLDNVQATFFKNIDLELFKYDFVSPISDSNAREILSRGFLRKVKDKVLEIPLKNVTIKARSKKIYKVDVKEFYKKNKSKYEDLSYEEFIKYSHEYPNDEELNSLLDDYPWDIIRRKKYKGLSIYSQRGCNWYKCSYCAIVTKPGRRLKVDKLIKILKNAKKNGIRYVTFEDDQFIQDENYIWELCEKIIKNNLNDIYYGAMIRVDSIKNYSLLEIMKRANFTKIQIGVESFVKEKIRYFRKYYEGKEEKYIELAKNLVFKLLENSIKPGIFIILTRPKDKYLLIEIYEEIKNLLELMYTCKRKFNKVPDVSINDLLFAYPNSYLINVERYKKLLYPLYVYENNGIYYLRNLEIPYIFDFKTYSHEVFVTFMKNLIRKKGLDPNTSGERFEHILEIIEVLEEICKRMDYVYVLTSFLYKLYKKGLIIKTFSKIGFSFNKFKNEYHAYLSLIKLFLKLNKEALIRKFLTFNETRDFMKETLEEVSREKTFISNNIYYLKELYFNIFNN